VSGNYYYVAIPSIANSRATWKLLYYSVGTTTQVSNGVNLSAEQFLISGLGGVY